MGALAVIWRRYILQRCREYSVVLFVIALYVILSFDSWHSSTSMDEDGMTTGYFRHDFHDSVHASADAFRKTHENLTGAKDLPSAILRALKSRHIQTIDLTDPMEAPLSNATRVVAGKVRSQRGDGREGLVVHLSSPWSTPFERQAYSDQIGVVALINLATYMSEVRWMARDVFFIFTASEDVYSAGIRLFAQCHENSRISLPRAGALRQMLSMRTKGVDDIHADPLLDDRSRSRLLSSFRTRTHPSILLEIEGGNGLLPNQDLVNAFMTEYEEERVPLVIRDAWSQLKYMALGRGAASAHHVWLSRGRPSFSFEAFFVRPESEGGLPAESAEIYADKGIVRSLQRLCCGLEGFLRAQSNLLQSLHHSTNFYFYVDTKAQVTNGVYIYPVMALLLPLIAWTYTSWPFRTVSSLATGLAMLSGFVVVGSLPVWCLLHRDTAFTEAPLRRSVMQSFWDESTLTCAPSLHAVERGHGEAYILELGALRTAEWLVLAGIGYFVVSIILIYRGIVFEATVLTACTKQQWRQKRALEKLVEQRWREKRHNAAGMRHDDTKAEGSDVSTSGGDISSEEEAEQFAEKEKVETFRELVHLARLPSSPYWLRLRTAARCAVGVLLPCVGVSQFPAALCLIALLVPPVLIAEPLLKCVVIDRANTRRVVLRPNFRWRGIALSSLLLLHYYWFCDFNAFARLLPHSLKFGCDALATMQSRDVELARQILAKIATGLLSAFSRLPVLDLLPPQWQRHNPSRFLRVLSEMKPSVSPDGMYSLRSRATWFSQLYIYAQHDLCGQSNEFALIWLFALPILAACACILFLPASEATPHRPDEAIGWPFDRAQTVVKQLTARLRSEREARKEK